MRTKFRNNKKRRYIAVIISILILIAVWILYPIILKLWTYTNGKHIEIVSLGVLLSTFIAIVWYSIETKKLRVINEKSFYRDRFNTLIEEYATAIRSMKIKSNSIFPLKISEVV